MKTNIIKFHPRQFFRQCQGGLTSNICGATFPFQKIVALNLKNPANFNIEMSGKSQKGIYEKLDPMEKLQKRTRGMKREKDHEPEM